MRHVRWARQASGSDQDTRNDHALELKVGADPVLVVDGFIEVDEIPIAGPGGGRAAFRDDTFDG